MRARERQPDERPRVLVPRPDHLGDVLLTLPAIRALRRRVPGVHVTLMVPPSLVPIAERAVDVDEALPMPFVIGRPMPVAGSGEVESAAVALRGRFDLGLVARPNDPWSGGLLTAASVPLRVGHPQPGTLPFLTHAFPERASRHVATEAVLLALHAGALLRPTGPRTRRSPEPAVRLLRDDYEAADRVLAKAGVGMSAPIIVHPTAGWPLKTWPVERWSRLVSDLAERSRRPVLVVGQSFEKAQLDALIDGSGGKGLVVHDVSLGTLAALHARAGVVVGIDSGALHLAALLGAPVVGLYGPFGAGRVAPIGPAGRIRALFRVLPCSPCGTLETPPCGARREPACLLAISTEDVVAAAVQLAGSQSKSLGADTRI
jgi:ADP-heptose:LPS heptosyltransferase